MEIQKDLLFKHRMKYEAEKISADILSFIVRFEKKVDDYEAFLEGFNCSSILKLDLIGKYLFLKYGEIFLFQVYIYYLNTTDAQYYRTKQNLQTTEEDGISSTEKRAND